MLIHNLILKELYKSKDKLNILYSHTDNRMFIQFFEKIIGDGHLSSFDDSIFAHTSVDLIICNNKIDALEKSVQLSHYFHCPLLIIDHHIKPEYIQASKILIPKITYLQIAVNLKIAHSWGIDQYHDVIDIDITNQSCVNKWNTIINNLSEQTFKMHKSLIK